MTNIIMAGVGGQGVLLACRVLMEAAFYSNYDVKESEIHGMAQRGGSVEAHVRFGSDVASPLIPNAAADFIVSFELCEAVRKLDYLGKHGVLFVNNEKVIPSSVQAGLAEYPEALDTWLDNNVPNVHLLDTLQARKDIGSKRCLNILMLGALSNRLDIPEENWLSAIRELVKPKYVDTNIDAFNYGRSCTA